MFRIAVCDNDERDLADIRGKLNIWGSTRPADTVEVTAFGAPAALSEALNTREFDAFLLDILMPEMDGITLARKIRRQNADVPVIFVTSATEFALPAYELHALRYLEKPVEQAELDSAMDAALLFYNGRRQECICLKSGTVVHNVPLDDIVCVENREHTAKFSLRDGTVITSIRRSGTFESAAAPLPSAPAFVQPHKSFLVNMRCISQLRPDSILLDNGREVPVSQKNAAMVKRKYFQFLLQDGAKG